MSAAYESAPQFRSLCRILTVWYYARAWYTVPSGRQPYGVRAGGCAWILVRLMQRRVNAADALQRERRVPLHLRATETLQACESYVSPKGRWTARYRPNRRSIRINSLSLLSYLQIFERSLGSVPAAWVTRQAVKEMPLL